MYRCQILFQVKQEAQKILTLLLRLEHDPTWQDKSNDEKAKHWSKLASMVHRYEQEHHVYHKFYFDGYDLRKIALAKREMLSNTAAPGTVAPGEPKIPPFGKETKRPSSAGYIEREPGFANDCVSEKEILTINDRI